MSRIVNLACRVAYVGAGDAHARGHKSKISDWVGGYVVTSRYLVCNVLSGIEESFSRPRVHSPA